MYTTLIKTISNSYSNWGLGSGVVAVVDFWPQTTKKRSISQELFKIVKGSEHIQKYNSRKKKKLWAKHNLFVIKMSICGNETYFYSYHLTENYIKTIYYTSV